MYEVLYILLVCRSIFKYKLKKINIFFLFKILYIKIYNRLK